MKKYTITITSGNNVINVSSVPLVAGDVDNSNVVNALDIGQTQEQYEPVGPTSASSDITYDGKVNALDLGLIIENYFKTGDN